MSRSLGYALVTALIVSGAIAGLAQLVTVGARQAVSARRAASAAYLAQSKIEELRSFSQSTEVDLSGQMRELIER